MKTFKDAKPQELTEEDYKALSRLEDDKDFIRFRSIVENGELKNALSFLRGAPLPEGVKDGESYYRGRYVMFRKIFDLIDTSDKKLKQLQDEKRNQE